MKSGPLLQFRRPSPHPTTHDAPGWAERAEVAAIDSKTPPEAEFSAYFNKAHYFLQIAEHSLDARMAAARGDRKAAIEHWKKAVEVEDSLNYGEPPEWYYPVRESLGGELLRDGRPSRRKRSFAPTSKRIPAIRARSSAC